MSNAGDSARLCTDYDLDQNKGNMMIEKNIPTISTFDLTTRIHVGRQAETELIKRLKWDRENTDVLRVSDWRWFGRESTNDTRTDKELQTAVAIGVDAGFEHTRRDNYRRMHEPPSIEDSLASQSEAEPLKGANSSYESLFRDYRLCNYSSSRRALFEDPKELQIAEETNEHALTPGEIVGRFLTDMMDELERAEAKFAPYNSYHEAYAVILEELDEFWEIVREKNDAVRDPVKARKELLQIAVTACRAAQDLGLNG